MRATRIVVAAAAVTVAGAGAALAMDNMMMEKGTTMMVKPDGTVAEMKSMDDKTSMMMMEKAKPLDHAVIVMMGEDGKMYLVEDAMMSDGKMLSDDMMMMSK
jgi:hypothetical protein